MIKKASITLLVLFALGCASNLIESRARAERDNPYARWVLMIKEDPPTFYVQYPGEKCKEFVVKDNSVIKLPNTCGKN